MLLKEQYYNLQVYLNIYTLRNASNYGRFFSTDNVLKRVANTLKPY